MGRHRRLNSAYNPIIPHSVKPWRADEKRAQRALSPLLVPREARLLQGPLTQCGIRPDPFRSSGVEPLGGFLDSTNPAKASTPSRVPNLAIALPLEGVDQQGRSTPCRSDYAAGKIESAGSSSRSRYQQLSHHSNRRMRKDLGASTAKAPDSSALC